MSSFRDGFPGGSLKAHLVVGTAELKAFMEQLGCPLAQEPLADAQEGRPIQRMLGALTDEDYFLYFA